MSETGCEPQREAKHMSLISAKARVNVARKNLQKLFDDVVGACGPPSLSDKKEEVKPTYTLVSVLNNTGNEIAEIAESMIGVIVDLRKEIL